MSIDIFYDEPKNEAFFKMPKVLFSEKYKDLSAEAKLLYGLMIDRTSLSVKNKWCDKNGEVFIYYTVAETCEKLGCGHDKATKLQRELVRHKLLRRERQGKSKPLRLYVLSVGE
ncbi:MAG: replication initiator protein A [Clostridia bacterium]|nr:replication initiator protein A [Clostridia bacterium]